MNCLISTGGDIVTLDRMGANGYTNNNFFSGFDGTSAACPQVSGVAALMLSANPTLTQAQVRTILQNTATDMGTTGFDNTFGFGRLNAQAALQAVTNGIFINNGGNLICTNTPISVNISGSNNIVWTSSSNITINGTGTNVTASSNSSGQGWIEARINGALCGLRRTVWAGVPATGSMRLVNANTGSPFYQLCIGQPNYIRVQHPSADITQWQW
ncbi:MAG: S8 family serine peptidase, partial [Bacteroidia bacterium]|nr:S8 family serine peptidase [Bacteroidia bacterium]